MGWYEGEQERGAPLEDLREPMEVAAAEVVFPADVYHLMPRWVDIPDEFKHWNGTKWNRLFNDWFYSGVEGLEFDLKPGIDGEKMMRHIRAVMGSFQPKHEHKEAAVSYLWALWADDVKWERRERSRA